MQRFSVIGLIVLAVLFAGTPVAVADSVADYQQLLKKYSAAIVTIKFTLKASAGGQEKETEYEIIGVMIGAKGQVLCSYSRLQGEYRFARTQQGTPITTSQRDFKVFIGDDTEGVEAKFVTREKELDLAWLQIKKPDEKGYACVDFEQSAKLEVGQKLFYIRRMGKFFDRVPVIGQTEVGGIISKPRELYAPAGQIFANLGTVLFTADGKVAGLVVWSIPEEAENNSAAVVESRGLIMPAKEIAKATKQAEAGAAKASEETPATQPAK